MEKTCQRIGMMISIALILALSACADSSGIASQPTSTPSPSPFLTATYWPTYTPTPTVAPTRTPYPTLEPAAMATRINELMADADCVYPCVMGVIPGVTNLDDAFSVFEPIATQTIRNVVSDDEQPDTYYFIVFDPLTAQFLDSYYLFSPQTKEISLIMAEAVPPGEYFSTYGKPDEIWFSSNGGGLGKPSYDLVLDYSSQSFVIRYRGDVEWVEAGVKYCLNEDTQYGTVLSFWKDRISDFRALDEYHPQDPNYVFRYRPLDQISDLIVDELYEGVLNHQTMCIISPIENWR